MDRCPVGDGRSRRLLPATPCTGQRVFARAAIARRPRRHATFLRRRHICRLDPMRAAVATRTMPRPAVPHPLARPELAGSPSPQQPSPRLSSSTPVPRRQIPQTAPRPSPCVPSAAYRISSNLCSMKSSMPEGTDKIDRFAGEFTRSGERCPGEGVAASGRELFGQAARVAEPRASSVVRRPELRHGKRLHAKPRRGKRHGTGTGSATGQGCGWLGGAVAPRRRGAESVAESAQPLLVEASQLGANRRYRAKI